MHTERAKKLRSINVDNLFEDIFGKNVSYKSIGHDDLERNRVFYIDDINVIFKLYGEIERWKKELIFIYY